MRPLIIMATTVFCMFKNNFGLKMFLETTPDVEILKTYLVVACN